MRSFFVILISLIISACVQTPQFPDKIDNIKINNGDILVLCEGLQGYDNSDISLISSATGISIADAYTQINSGIRLGDTANDMILHVDTIYVCSTIGNYIELIDAKNLRTIRRIQLPPNSAPRKMVVDSHYIYCTLLFESSIAIINKYSEEIKLIQTGPQPEGIALLPNNVIITANSAYGDFNANHPDAETISVIDLNFGTEINKIKIGPNVCEVLYNPKNNMIYAAYYNLPSNHDALGEIIEISIPDFIPGRRWKCNPFRLNLSYSGDTLFFINQNRNMPQRNSAAVGYIALESGEIGSYYKLNYNDIYYSLAISPFDGTIWVANAKNHQSNGYITKVLGNDLPESFKFNVSLNPNKIIFVR